MYFDEFKAGDRFESEPKTIEAGDILTYANLSGDLNPLHLDDSYAQGAGFRSRIAHGMLTLAVGIGRWYSINLTRDTTIALLGINSVSFKAAVYPGDRIRLVSEVSSCRVSERRPDAGIVTFKDAVLNQEGKEVLACERVLMLRRKPPG